MRKSLLAILTIFIVGCSTIQITEETTSTTPNIENGIDVFFSDPTLITGGDYNYGPEMFLVDAIQAARVSIDIAVYRMNLWDLRNAIINAHQSGVVVRMVTDSDSINDEVVKQIQESGIKVIGDERESLMHNKFVVIDRQDVWTGSMNFTVGSAYYDNNNLIHIHSQEVALDYVTEFDEMFNLEMFGDNVIASTPNPLVNLGGSLVEVYFSPDDNVDEHIINIIEQGQENIIFMAYSFTSNSIGEAILEKFYEGVNVSGVMDSNQAVTNQGTNYDSFVEAGISVMLDENSGLMHHKVIIVDNKIVITGSYNFSNSAENKNDENLLIIHDPGIADLYKAEYLKLISLNK